MFIYFDMDATLVSIEWTDHIAKKYWVYDKVAKITQATMNGDIDFTTGFFEKMSILQPSKHDVLELGSLYPSFLTPGIKQIIEKYKNIATIGIISHGFTLATKEIQLALWLNEKDIYAVDILFDAHGSYQWFPPGQELLEDLWKWILIGSLKKNNPTIPIIMIGDGHNDLKTQWIADYFIGCGINIIRPLVQAQSQYYATSIDELDSQLASLTGTGHTT
jgi:phosphoserine phosphatase